MLDFNDDGNDECDENTEEDLITLKDPSGNMNLVVTNKKKLSIK